MQDRQAATTLWLEDFWGDRVPKARGLANLGLWGEILLGFIPATRLMWDFFLRLLMKSVNWNLAAWATTRTVQ